jgi:hypothetical protein
MRVAERISLLEAENERLRDENKKLCEYVHEAATGDQSALLPIDTLRRLVFFPDEERQAITLALRARMRDECGTFHELLRRAVSRLEAISR